MREHQSLKTENRIDYIVRENPSTHAQARIMHVSSSYICVSCDFEMEKTLRERIQIRENIEEKDQYLCKRMQVQAQASTHPVIRLLTPHAVTIASKPTFKYQIITHVEILCEKLPLFHFCFIPNQNVS